MINLEWFRTFRTVYKTKSLSRASDLLNISQPTVSQHINSLEQHIGQQLFTRKSKGVIETDEGKIVNTLISGSIESLEEAETILGQRHADKKTIITIGISQHLYKTVLCSQILELGSFVHVKFGTRDSLIKDIEQGRLLYGIIPGEADTFDINYNILFKQKLVLVQTPGLLDPSIAELYRSDSEGTQQLLTNQKWFAHDAAAGYIKLFWLHRFNKKRPSIVPNYVIPNEYETLFQLSESKGLTVALDSTVTPFLKNNSLEISGIPPVDFRNISLISSKKKAPIEFTEKLVTLLTRKT